MSLPDLDGLTAVITGASRGIGAGLAEHFAERGINLGLCSRSKPKMRPSSKVVASELDVGDEVATEAFAERVIEHFGSIDLWINNAGVLEPIAPLRKIRSAEFEAQLRINVLGVVHGSRAFIAHRRALGEAGGVLVNMSSGAAWHGYAGWSPYCASKAAVDRITECIQLEEAEAGLRAYAVAPGVVDTDMQSLIRSSKPEDFPMVDKFHKMKKEGSFNTIEFVADRILRVGFDPDERPDEVVVRLPAEKE